MKGFIKIEAITLDGSEGLSVETYLRDVNYADRLQVLHSMCHALKITPAELKLMAGLIDSGFADEVADVKVLHDDTTFSDTKAAGVAELLKMLLK